MKFRTSKNTSPARAGEKAGITSNTAHSDSGEDQYDDKSHIIQEYESFDDMGLKEDLLRGIYNHGWENPSDIQKKGIIPVLSGNDVLCQAQSGKGKTGTFAVGALQMVDPSKRQTQVLILAPARELADQIFEVLQALGRWMENLYVKELTGGRSVRQDIRDLRRSPQIVVGTPGRVLHMVGAGCLDVSGLLALVLDEADVMLDRGFEETMYDIFGYLPERVQLCMFSATLPEQCLRLSQKFLRNPIRILVKKEELSLAGLKQYFVDCGEEHFKYGVIKDLYQSISIQQLMIFCNTVQKVEELASRMNSDQFTVSCIHGKMDTAERELRMKEFRNGASRVLISTDLLGRGIDVSNVGLVLNYDVPRNDPSQYLHRIGRSARFGKKGLAINFLTKDSYRDYYAIQEYYSITIPELPNDFADEYQ